MWSESELTILAGTFLFRGCAPEEIAGLLEQVSWERRQYPKGGVIYTPASFVQELGILLSGRVRVTKGDLVVSELHQGDLFGAAALFNDEETYVSTLTVRAPCEVVFLSQHAVQTLLDRDERIRRSYIHYLSARIRFLSGKIDALVQGSVERKLSSYLLRRMDGDGRVYAECSMVELAQRLNMGRASLYRDLRKLEDMGAVAREGKDFVVKQPELLARL